MKKRKSQILLVVLFTCALYAVFANDVQETVKRTVESFCKSEFDADTPDKCKMLIKFSSTRAAEEEKRDPLFHGWGVALGWDPLFVVDSYKVIDVEVKNDHAVATVVYKRIARSEGKDSIIADPKDSDMTKVDLIYDGKQWWILDPPLPRVSKRALVEFYQDNLKSYGDKWLERLGITEHQKQSYRKKQAALQTLQNIQ